MGEIHHYQQFMHESSQKQISSTAALEPATKRRKLDTNSSKNDENMPRVVCD